VACLVKEIQKTTELKYTHQHTSHKLINSQLTIKGIVACLVKEIQITTELKYTHQHTTQKLINSQLSIKGIMACLVKEILAIYGPMIYTAPYVMFLILANPLLGPLEGLGYESLDFFWA